MERVRLGKTDLHASVLGLGGGGTRRLGTAAGKSQDEAVALVREALTLGINLFDTSEKYGTEGVLGQALRDASRSDVVISTKYGPYAKDGTVKPADALHDSLEASLARLQTGYVDVYHLHGVKPDSYADVYERLVPELQRAQEKGLIRYLGITELFSPDPGHEMLQQAVRHDVWDVIMVGFNILNQSARQRVFPQAKDQGVGVIGMFAVRNALSKPASLRQHVERLIEEGLVDAAAVSLDDPLDFLVRAGGAVNVVDAAYRFCLHEAGLDTVLCGTGSIDHLRENVASVERGPLPAQDQARLRQMFHAVDTVSGH